MEPSGNFPLLVKVQSIDINALDSKVIGTFKPRNVTFVETSNLLIFVGVTSGTVYVFSRETFAFKYLIPFAGGKVCCIACSEPEKGVSIGSIRGQVSIYELIQDTEKVQNPNSSVAFFRHITTLDHHKGNEITELIWSPNGVYLFAGDTRGVVSQTDMSVPEDIPRPMSQIILRLESRIIQLQFLFPILAICTISAVFLGDIENEDFARVQFDTKEQIQATGLALIMSYVDSSEKQATIHLYVSEMKTGLLHRFSLQGKLLASEKITANVQNERSVPVFDPLLNEDYQEAIKPMEESVPQQNISLGKLLLSHGDLLLSISHGSLSLIDPNRMSILYWNDEFRKIHNAKLQSNYVFLWSGTKVTILSLTDILPYTLQLTQSGESLPVERWIHHCLLAFGYSSQNQDAARNQQVIEHCSAAFDLKNASGPNGDLFRKLISLHVPFEIPVEETQTSPSDFDLPTEEPSPPLLVSLRKLLAVFEAYSVGKRADAGYFDGLRCYDDWHVNTETPDVAVSTVLNAVASFYSEAIPSWKTLLEHGPLSLAKLMSRIETAWMNANVVNLYENLDEVSVAHEGQIMNSKLQIFLDNASIAEEDMPVKLFSAFTKQMFVFSWFDDLGREQDAIHYDGLYADFVMLLFPLMSPEMRIRFLSSDHGYCHGFCFWLLFSTVYSVGQFTSPYNLQLMSLFAMPTLNVPFIRTIFTSMYGDLAQSRCRPAPNYLHHLLSVVYFVNLSEGASSVETFMKKDIAKSLLITCFPLKHWPRGKIVRKFQELWDNNSALFKMFEEACLYSEDSAKLCQCGVPLNCYQYTHTHGTDGSSFFTIIKEIVLERRLQLHVSFPEHNPFPLDLAMKTRQFKKLWSTHIQSLDDFDQMDIILRTGSCALLRAWPMSKIKVRALLKRRDYIVKYRRCFTCEDELALPRNFKVISMDCIALAVFHGPCAGSVDKFSNVVKGMEEFKVPGVFSTKFYEVIGSTPRGPSDRGGIGSPIGRVPHVSLPCAVFH